MSKLIYHIGLELKSVPESAPDYQDLVNELAALDRAIKQIFQIRPGVHELKRLDGVRALAATCQIPLQEFLGKIQKFNKSLGPWNGGRYRAGGFGRGLQWSLIWKEEVSKLRSKLTPKLSTILILLTSQIMDSVAKAEVDRASIGNEISAKVSLQQVLLERLETQRAITQVDAHANHTDLTNALQSQGQTLQVLQVETKRQGSIARTRLDEQGAVLKEIQQQTMSSGNQVDTVSTQVVAIQQDVALIRSETGSILDFLARMWRFTVDRAARLNEIAELITQLLTLILDMTKETMHMVLDLLREIKEIRQRLLCIERYLPMQMHYPMIQFRDAFNTVTPFPFSVFREWEGAKRMVAAIFVNKQGLRRVEMGQWFVTHVKKGVKINPRFWDKALQPGDELSMTMVFDNVQAKEGYCPYPSCGADMTSAEIMNGGRYCRKCCRFFQLLQQQRGDTADASGAHREMGPFQNASSSGAVQSHNAIMAPDGLLTDREPLPPDAPEAPSPSELGHDEIDEYCFIQVMQARPMIQASTSAPSNQKAEDKCDPLHSTQLVDQPSEYITMFVQELGHKTLCFRLLQTASIRDIRTIISERRSIPKKRQRLSFVGKSLQNDMTLESAGIKDGNTIRLVQRTQNHSDIATSSISAKDDTVSRAELESGDATRSKQEDVLDQTSTIANADESVYQSNGNGIRKESYRKSPPIGSGWTPDRFEPYKLTSADRDRYKPRYTEYYSPPYESTRYSRNGARYDAAKRRPVTRSRYGVPENTYDYENPYNAAAPTNLYNAPTYIYGDVSSKRTTGSTTSSYHYYGQEEAESRKPTVRAARRPTTLTPLPRASRPKSNVTATVRMATEADALRHKVPAGYSLKNWDPTETPILLLGSVFDANSLGKWIYDWTVYHHNVATPMADLAGELWLLIIQLAGKRKRSEETMERIRKTENRDMVEDFLESAERLWDRLKKLLKDCEHHMLKTRSRKSEAMGKKAGTEFIDSIFGRDRHLEQTEKLMSGIRLWNMRFDANCEDILRRPTQ